MPRLDHNTLQCGDEVMAKWPGTTLFYKAIVKSLDFDTHTAEVIFSNDTVFELPFDYIEVNDVCVYNFISINY